MPKRYKYQCSCGKRFVSLGRHLTANPSHKVTPIPDKVHHEEILGAPAPAVEDDVQFCIHCGYPLADLRKLIATAKRLGIKVGSGGKHA